MDSTLLSGRFCENSKVPHIGAGILAPRSPHFFGGSPISASVTGFFCVVTYKRLQGALSWGIWYDFPAVYDQVSFDSYLTLQSLIYSDIFMKNSEIQARSVPRPTRVERSFLFPWLMHSPR